MTPPVPAAASIPRRPAPSARRWEYLTPLVISAVLLAVTQRFSGLDTPDSSFYASLSLFGAEVTDRAPIDSYYWTRLGYIAPVHWLTSLLGPWLGFFTYKAFLLLVLSGSTFVLLRRHATWAVATFLTLIVATSTVILSYLGNTYLTGTVLPGTAAVIALATRLTRGSLATAGVVLGWLAMVNPPGFLLAAVVWCALAIHGARSSLQAAPSVLRGAVLVLITAGLTFLAFLGMGAVLFPGMDWWRTFTATTAIEMSDFASSSPIWLQDISLLVPASALIIVTVTWVRNRSCLVTQQAWITSVTSITFMLVFSPIMGGITLEAPLYQSMLWPPSLIAIALAMTTRTADFPGVSRAWFLVIAFLGIALVIAAGFLDPGFTFTTGVIVMSVLTALVLATPRSTLATLLVVSTWAAGAQLTQNSRDDLGLYYLSPYNWAYAPNPVETKIRTAVNSQVWLLDNTQDDDSILVWVDGPWTQGDRELFVAAGMQLWGENRITLEPTLTDEYGLTQLATYEPDVLALYGKSMEAVMRFWESIPEESDPTALICYDYAWPADPSTEFPTEQGHTCLTRLTW